jgi:lactoylglutathione lyase
VLNIESVNHIGIRIADKERSIAFYQQLGFQFSQDAGFEQGHPIVMRHPSAVVLNLLGPASQRDAGNILMDVDEKHTGITHFALTVENLGEARAFVEANDIAITGSFSFKGMSAIFIRDPDRNVIELDAFESSAEPHNSGYSNHP